MQSYEKSNIPMKCKAMMRCKDNDSHLKLANAHIIPRSFYKGSPSVYSELKVRESYVNKIYGEFRQAGLYDSEMICGSCEKVFNRFDTHGYKVLSKALKNKVTCYGSDGKPFAYRIENADYSLLKLFFISMLWRAHASSLDFFSLVDLGPHASRLLSYIDRGEAPSFNEYEVVLFHQINNPKPFVIYPPYKVKPDGVNCYKLYLPNVIALIKVDKQPLPKLLKRASLSDSSPNRLFFLSYSNSPEMLYLRKTLMMYASNIIKH